ncbi:hypothetical protein RHGRI_033899 [Rhododendron griersonianum]|uniref:PB1-like domain-containing protein n=1 Tax=Rhododendron griersonianum TaxID=479676 RepID=A0AAV6I1S4_9ERIC|nr:hypothetical protein RHGRI_033899 [Rhododendron griersonianum]
MEETPDLRCTLLVRVSGKLVRGAHWEYKDGVTAEIKVDPDSYTFYEFMDVIREIGYTVEKDNISVYYTLPPDMNNDINNGLVSLRNHDDMVNMFAAHLLIGMKYFCIDIYVDCPNVVDSEDEEFIGVDQGCITELGGDQEVGEGEGERQGGGHQFGEVGVGEGQGGGEQDGDVGEVGVGVEGVDANKSGEMNDDDDSSDSEWFPNDDSSTSTASFSGVEESSDEEEEESIPLVGLGKSLLRSLASVSAFSFHYMERPKVPIPRFGGAGTIAPRIGLPNPQGWRRSSRIGNAVFWSQPSSSSAASCASGSGSGSATMPTTPIPRLDSQGASSTPSSTQKSGI